MQAVRREGKRMTEILRLRHEVRGGSNVEARSDTSVGREERIESLVKNESIWGDVGEILTDD